MLGKILRYAVEPGAHVNEDDAIVVMEAMKMEIEIVAPRAGTLREIRVKVGDAVDAGDVVAVID